MDQGRQGRVHPRRAEVLGSEDLRDRSGPARRPRQGRQGALHRAGRREPDPLGLSEHRPVSTRPAGAGTAPCSAPRTSRPSPSAAPARSQVGDARAFLADMARIHKEHVLTDFNLWANEEGTPILVDPVNGAGALPTRNWSAGELRGRGRHQLGGLPEGQGGQPGLLPMRPRLPPGARGRWGEERRTGVRDHRPLRRELRGGRSRGADALQPRVRRMGSRHHLVGVGGGLWPWT